MTAYSDAGVNVQKADELVKFLNMSGFGASLDLGDGRKLTLSTDGVGTKVLWAKEMEIYDTIGIDLVAMCVNDLICEGATPIAFLDYYATGKLDLEKSKKIMKGILRGCELANCPLVGGETAEMPGVYPKNGFDLAGFAAGIVEKGNSLPKKTIKEGDLVIGIPSNGFHSNGFSLLRKIFKENDIALFDECLAPTRIYVDEVIPNISMIKSAAHITGGGIHGNLPRALPDHLTYDAQFPMSDIFDWFYHCEIGTNEKTEDMTVYEFESVFNCGWGMILISETEEILDHILDAKVLGSVISKGK